MPFKVHLALFTACFFWGISFIASKTALTTIPALNVVMLRLIISAICFGGWMLIRRKWPTFRGWSWLGLMFILSLFNSSLHYGSQTIGLKYTTAANASLYCLTGPISILLLSTIFLNEKLTIKKVSGILLALAGVITVMGWETLTAFELTQHLKGDLLVIASIFMWGIFTVMSKHYTSRGQYKMNAMELTAITTFSGALQMIPIGFMEATQVGFQWSQVSAMAWASVAFLGITCSFLAVQLYVWAITQAESQKVGIYLYTITPITYIFAVLFLDEKITANLMIGSLLVVAGVWLTDRKN